MLEISCVNCGFTYPDEGLPYCCPSCGGIFGLTGRLDYEPSAVDGSQPGLWKYWHSFGLKKFHEQIYMGEGNTPLVWDSLNGKNVGFKLESQNPTGSYKDRGAAVLAAHLLEREIRNVVEDSSGNAGASLAGYAARCGIHARIYVPETASGPKRNQIEEYGAELVSVPGPRSAATGRVLEAAGMGMAYASHAYLPFGLAGIATIAYELAEQYPSGMGTILAPVGHGGLLLGLIKGFEALRNNGAISWMPEFVGVQADNCNPVHRQYLGETMDASAYSRTVAEGISVSVPIRGGEVIRGIRQHGGRIISINEREILPDREELCRKGIFVEPTSAIVWSGLKLIQAEITEPAILVMSGSGLKYSKV